MNTRSIVQHLSSNFLTLSSAPGHAKQTIRWILPTCLTFIIVNFFFGPHFLSLGFLGAQIAHTGRNEPLRTRAKLLLFWGFLGLLFQCSALLASSHSWLLPPLLTGFTLVIVWIWDAALVGAPGPIHILFPGAYAALMAIQGFTIRDVLPSSIVCYVLASVISLLMIAIDPYRPTREAVGEAESAIRKYCKRPAQTPARYTNRLRSAAYIAVSNAWNILRSSGNSELQPRGAQGRSLFVRLKKTHLSFIQRLYADSFPTAPREIFNEIETLQLGRPPLPSLLRTAFTMGSQASLIAVRAAASVLLASSAIVFSPVGHQYWAVMSAMIIVHMNAPRVQLTIRAVHRIIGTGLGIVAVFCITLLQLNQWIVLGIVMLALYAMEYFAAHNYSLSVIGVTVYALMIVPTSRASMSTLILDRFVETIVGVGAAVIVIWLVGRKSPVLVVRSQYRRTLWAIAAVLRDQAKNDWTSERALTHIKDLAFAQERAGIILSSQRPDDPQSLTRWMPIQDRVSQFGWTVLIASKHSSTVHAQKARETCKELLMLLYFLQPISKLNIDTEQFMSDLSVVIEKYMRGTHN